MAAADQLTALMSLIQGVTGKSQTTTSSGGTQTSQQNVSDQGVNQLINQILSGSGGVKSIGSRARGSGLYNSTSEDILLGNLYATAANQAELARTPTVTTTSPTTSTTKTPGTGIGELATGLGGAYLASSLLNIGGKALSPVVNSASNSVGDFISGIFGGGSSSGTGKGIFDDIDVSAGGINPGASTASSTSFSSGEGYGLDTSTLGSFGGSSGVKGGTGVNFGLDLDSGEGSINLAGGGGLGALAGSLLSSFAGSALSPSTNSGSAGSGGATGGSIICTALMKKGLLDKELYAAGDKYIQKVPAETKVGYYAWARNIAAKIDSGHKGWTKVCLPFATGRTALLASRGTFSDHVVHPLGTLTKFVGEPVCRMIGTYLLWKNPEIKTQLQGV
jgi:hypothetical protein